MDNNINYHIVDAIEFSSQAKKYIQKSNKKEWFKKKIQESFSTYPPVGNITWLQGSDKEKRGRLTIGGYRVIFKYNITEIYVVYIEKIRPRGDVYKGGLL